MATVKEMKGQRFGKLEVIERYGSTSQHKATWACKCDCGMDYIAVGYLLRKGETTSCGCDGKEVRLSFNGETKSMSQWARDLGCSRAVIWFRKNIAGWSDEKTLTTPLGAITGRRPSGDNGEYKTPKHQRRKAMEYYRRIRGITDVSPQL